MQDNVFFYFSIQFPCFKHIFSIQKQAFVFLQYRILWTEFLASCSWDSSLHHRLKTLIHAKILWECQMSGNGRGLDLDWKENSKLNWQMVSTVLITTWSLTLSLLNVTSKNWNLLHLLFVFFHLPKQSAIGSTVYSCTFFDRGSSFYVLVDFQYCIFTDCCAWNIFFVGVSMYFKSMVCLFYSAIVVAIPFFHYMW